MSREGGGGMTPAGELRWPAADHREDKQHFNFAARPVSANHTVGVDKVAK